MLRASRSLLFVCAALACGAPASWAQTAEEVIAKNLEAKGGIERLRDTTTVRVTGTITQQGLKGTMLNISKRPNLFRREMDLGGQKMIQGFDGTTLWMQRSGLPPQEMPPGPQTEMLKQDVSFDPPFLDWQQKGHTIHYKERFHEKGKDYDVLTFTPKDRPPVEYYIDAKTGLEARTLMTMDDPGGGGKARLETRFTDYREVDGRMIPFVTTNLVNGTVVAQVRLDKIEFNVPLDDSVFRMPK
jgi:outer membrane lipoprotein-sorting protein